MQRSLGRLSETLPLKSAAQSLLLWFLLLHRLVANSDVTPKQRQRQRSRGKETGKSSSEAAFHSGQFVLVPDRWALLLISSMQARDATPDADYGVDLDGVDLEIPKRVRSIRIEEGIFSIINT